MRKLGIRDNHPGSATRILVNLDPDHSFKDQKILKTKNVEKNAIFFSLGPP
jgi:hypothetical protein